jgi:hypothetical protein
MPCGARRIGAIWTPLGPAPRGRFPADRRILRFDGQPSESLPAAVTLRLLYTDHGGCFTDASLARTCAVLGIKLVHSQPGQPAGRGKIEKVFQTIQQQFLVEVTGDRNDPPATLSPAWTI